MERRKKRELHAELPARSDPNYMKLWREKNKGRAKELHTRWRKEKLEKDPDFYKKKYNREKQIEYWEKNRPVLSEKQWAKRGIKDMSYSFFLEELEKQKNKCAICEKELTKPQVDHDHNTGHYRGILCIPCNSGLGIYELKREKFEMYLKRIVK